MPSLTVLALAVALGPAGAQEIEGETATVDAEAPSEPAPSEPVPEEAPSGEAPVESEAEPIELPEPAPKKPKKKPSVSTQFFDDFELRYWQVPDRLPDFPDSQVLNYVEQVNRFTANVRAGKFRFYGQLDQVALMANRYFLDDVPVAERELLSPGMWSPLIPGAYDPTTHGMSGWDLVSRNLYVNLEKLRFGYDDGDVVAQVGDFYVALGRGIALNLNRNVDIDIDTSLQGAKVFWRPGAWDLQAFVGQANRQQVFQDNPNLDLFGDRRHTVGGVAVQRYGLGPVNLGGHGVVYNFVLDEGWQAGMENLATTPDVVVGGGTIEAFGLGPTDWFFEGDGFAFPTDATFGGDDRTPGYALYLSGTAYAGIATITLEGKRYYNSQRVNALLAPELYQMSVGPTLEYERQITEDSAAAVNSNDIYGGKLQADFTAIPGILVPYASLAVFRDLDLGGLHFNERPETIFHPLVGLEYTDGSYAVIFNAGYRIDKRDGEGGADRHLHGDVLAKLPVTKGFAFDVSAAAEWYRWGNNRLQQDPYVEVETSLSLSYKSLVTFTWFTDYSTNPLIDSIGNLTDTVYGAAEVQVRPVKNVAIRAFYGAYKSGIRCSGGQCRVLPGFEGARLAVTADF